MAAKRGSLDVDVEAEATSIVAAGLKPTCLPDHPDGHARPLVT
jgi:hypothetical protein